MTSNDKVVLTVGYFSSCPVVVRWPLRKPEELIYDEILVFMYLVAGNERVTLVSELPSEMHSWLHYRAASFEQAIVKRAKTRQEVLQRIQISAKQLNLEIDFLLGINSDEDWHRLAEFAYRVARLVNHTLLTGPHFGAAYQGCFSKDLPIHLLGKPGLGFAPKEPKTYFFSINKDGLEICSVPEDNHFSKPNVVEQIHFTDSTEKEGFDQGMKEYLVTLVSNGIVSANGAFSCVTAANREHIPQPAFPISVRVPILQKTLFDGGWVPLKARKTNGEECYVWATTNGLLLEYNEFAGIGHLERPNYPLQTIIARLSGPISRVVGNNS